jgi:hypothetical protein
MSTVRLKLTLIACGLGWLLAGSTAARAQSYDNELWNLLTGSEGEGRDWPRHFRVGALVGFHLKADFAMNGQFAVAGSNPGTPGGGQNHEYDDGYVRVDATGNYGGQTWNWGYQNSSQLIGDRLYFHSANSYTASDSASVSGDPQVGFDSSYGGHLFPLWGGAFGWELGFGLLPIKIKNNLSLPTFVTGTVHSFDASGIDLPDAPYQGGFGGPSATISDYARVEPGYFASGGILSGSQTLDVTLYNIRLGPTLHWELSPRFAMEVSAGAALGILTGGLDYNEVLVLPNGGTAANQGKVGDTQLVYGGYIAGTLMYHVEQNGDLYLGFQYMPMTSATFSGDGRSAKLDLTGGLYLSAGVNWPF